MMRRRKIGFLGILGLLLLALPGCNEGVDGFVAPHGSTIAMPAGGTYKVLTEQSIIMHVGVDVPGGGGNGIQIMFSCVWCELLDAPAGQDIFEAIVDNTLVSVANPYLTRTDDLGQRIVVVRVTAPANFGETSYEAEFWADIVVTAASTKLTVETF